MKGFLGTDPLSAFFLEVHDKMGQRRPNRFYYSGPLEHPMESRTYVDEL